MSSRAKRIQCFYCGEAVLEHRIEQDHFPVPASCGGTQTVPACAQCHDLKDRTSWDTLSVEMKGEFMEEFARMGRAGKIVFAQFMRTVFQAKAIAEAKERPSEFVVGDRMQLEHLGTVEITKIDNAPPGARTYHLRQVSDSP